VDGDEAGSVVGAAVRRHRLAAGFTQEELAGRAGVSVRTLRDLERGRIRQPRARSVRGLANALELSVAQRDALLVALTSTDSDDRRPRVGVLGPLVVSRAGVGVTVRSQRQRALLGLLALHHGAAVPVSEIVDVLWGERPPRTARNLVQMYVGELRALLGATSVLFRAGGYVLELPARRLDLAEFDDLAEQAYREGRTERALRLLVEALRCWRGGVLADAGTRLRQHPRAVAAEQGRVAAAIALADLATGLDHPAAATDLLPAICREAPLHEELHARWMVVLARAGQQAEALRVFAELRERLDTELGVEPGAELREVHLDVLRGRLTMAADPTWRAIPAQLPAAASDFTGRAEHLDVLHRLSASSRAVVIASVAGMAGVGKSALAVYAAHQIADRYPDGQLFVDLHGYTQGIAPVEPGEALDRMLRALGVPETRIPASLDERAALYRTRLADTRVLVVLDNASVEAQVTPLLPGAPGSLVLITSRRRLDGLDHTHVLSLDTLPVPEAVELLTRTAGEGRLRDQPPHLLVELVELCGRLPLAIRIAAARLRSHPTWHPSHLIERLRDERQRLVELEAGQRSVIAVLDVSYHHLRQDERRAYRLLGLHPGPDIDSHAAAALFDKTPRHAARLLDQLHEAHLLLEPAPGRYQFHDLIRAHAAITASRDRTEPSAVNRLLDYYRHTASLAVDAAYPNERKPPRVPPAPTPTPDLADPEQALGWLNTELTNLLAAANRASEAHVLDLSAILHQHLYARGRYRDAETLHNQALTIARSTGHRAGELTALTNLGDTHRMQDRHRQASNHYQQALRLASTTATKLTALVGLGQTHLMQDGAGQANDYFQRARQLASTTDDLASELTILNGLGCVHRRLGQLQQACDYYGQALELARGTGHRGTPAELAAMIGFGEVHRLRGEYEQATGHYEQALELARATGHSDTELNALTGLGNIHRRLGRYEQADDVYQRLLTLASQAGSRNFEFEAWQGLGRLRHSTDDPDAAIAHHNQALTLATELGQRTDQARAHDGLAYAHHLLNQHEHARRHWQRTLDILTRLGASHADDEETTRSTVRARLAALDQQGAV
jgi:DNA-binding SARP family transcriptional activator/tetratricopeptide (TPR) repeat protein/DNA-binding XRE family transcriptional regulator